MLLRIRSNVSVVRIEISSLDITFAELSKLVQEKCRISNVLVLVFAGDIMGSQCYPFEATLAEKGLTHGTELYLVGKFEEVFVEKSFVNEHHEVVPAGKSWKMLSAPDQYEAMVKKLKGESVDDVAKDVAPEDAKDSKQSTNHYPVDSSQTVTANNFDAVSNPTPNVPAKSSIIDAKVSANTHATYINQIPAASDNAWINDYESFAEDDVRAPEASQRITMIQDNADDRLSKDGKEEVAALRKQLTSIGMREYDIEQEVLQLTDELLAKKMAKSMEMEDRTTNFGYGISTLEELEKILKQNNRPIVKRGSQNSNIGTTAARSGNLNAYNKERYNLSNPTSTNHKPDGATKPNNAFSAAGQRVLNNVPPPVSINPRSSGRVLAAGEKALPRSPEKAEEHDDFVGSWIRNQTQKNVPTISSKPPQPRSGQNDGSMIEVLKQRAAAKAKAETKSAAESRQRNTDNRSSTANQTSINGFEDEDSLMQLALEMSLKEQQAKIHQQIPSNVRISSRDEELGMLNERSSAMMRDFLHNNDAMPAWLQQSINKSAEEDLLNLTAAFSTNEGYSNNHTFSSSSSALTSNYSHFLQEDEDEMLAKALKDIDELESLNREANNKQDYRSTLIEGTDEDQLLAKAIEKIERDDREKQEKAKETEDEELARAIQDSLQFN